MKSPLARLIFALVACGTTLVGYGVWYVTIAGKSTAVANLENQITRTIETSSRIASVRATLDKITGDEAIVQGYFVPETGVVAFINDLEARGHLVGSTVSVLSVTTGGTPVQPTLVLTLTANGTFDAVMRTIGTIEYAPYALSISELSLRQNSKNSWGADLKLSVGSLPSNTTASTGGSDAPKKITP